MFEQKRDGDGDVTNRVRGIGGVGYPPPPSLVSHHAWGIVWYKTLEVPQDFTLSFEPVLCELLSTGVEKICRGESRCAACPVM